MKTRIILIGLLIALFACDSDDKSQLNFNINGLYIGIFERDGYTSNVELEFANGTFSGASEVINFPAICNGTYLISNNTVEFENQCVFTSDFDWSLILWENWDYSFNNNTLIITKTNGDKYTLIKQ